jgi:hypothetical protein
MRVNPPLAFDDAIGYVGNGPNWTGGRTGPDRPVG